jgi:membrane associated rhomboid family serine protease
MVSLKESGDRESLLKPMIVPGLFLLIMWVSFLLGSQFEREYIHLGVYPRKISGLLGILTGPFVHSGWEHLIFNSWSFFFMGFMLFYFYRNVADKVLMLSFILTGLCTWMFARPSFHVGMSGVVYGMFSFLFFGGFISTNRKLIVASFITILMYGSMVWGLIPGQKGISWESHLFGFMVGIICLLLFAKELRMSDYSFEDKDEEDEYMQFQQGTDKENHRQF